MPVNQQYLSEKMMLILVMTWKYSCMYEQFWRWPPSVVELNTYIPDIVLLILYWHSPNTWYEFRCQTLPSFERRFVCTAVLLRLWHWIPKLRVSLISSQTQIYFPLDNLLWRLKSFHSCDGYWCDRLPKLLLKSQLFAVVLLLWNLEYPSKTNEI